MNNVSAIVTCKGRLHHIRETLPLLAADCPDEIIFVDYGCPDDSGAWVRARYPRVTVINITDDPGFSLSRARNLGAQKARYPWLCFVDADVKVKPGFFAWLRKSLHPRCFYRAGLPGQDISKEIMGSCVCSRAAFMRIGGYDEVFAGWGGEDFDFYDRLRLLNVAEDRFSGAYLEAILHDDKERTSYHKIKDLRSQVVINRFYRAAKNQIMFSRSVRTELPLETREKLYKKIERVVMDWTEDVKAPYPVITITIPASKSMSSSYYIAHTTSIELRLEKKMEGVLEE